MSYLPRGKFGHYGLSHDIKYNKKVIESNKLIDELNKNINSFATYEENENYILLQFKKINSILGV